MRPSTELFDLIQKMDTSERGFFIKYAKKQGEKPNYIRLFQALCKMKTYDREVLKQKFKGESFINNLHVVQNYLFKTIMQSLRQYREARDVDVQLQNYLVEAQIAEEKGLFVSMDKVLEKAKKLALNHHKYGIVLEILERQVTQVVARNVDNVLETTQLYYDQIKETLHILKEEFTYKSLNHQLLLCYRLEKRNAPVKYAQLLREITEHPYLIAPSQPQSFFSQHFRYNLRCVEARMYEDREAAHENYLNMLALWERHTDILNQNIKRYKNNVSNFLGNAITGHFFEKVPHYLAVLEELEPRNFIEAVESFQNLAMLKLLYVFNKPALEEAKVFLPGIKEKLIEYEEALHPGRAVVLYYNMLILHFLLEEYSEAQVWANKIHELDKETPRQDIKSFARILTFVLHFEQGHGDVLESLIRKAQWQLNKESAEDNYQKPYEEKLLTFFKSLMTVKNKSDKLALFKAFHHWLDSKKDQQPQYIGIHELLIWLESRISNETLRTVFERKLKKSPV